MNHNSCLLVSFVYVYIGICVLYDCLFTCLCVLSLYISTLLKLFRPNWQKTFLGKSNALENERRVESKPTHFPVTSSVGRAIAQPVSRWFPTAAARVQTRVKSCGICGGAGFLRVFRFPLPIFIPPISTQSPSSINWGWYNRPVRAAVPKAPTHKLKTNYFLHMIFVGIMTTIRL
jgi:hypothetical protein